MKFLLITLVLLLTQIPCLADSVIGIIPQPLSINKGEGYFTINESTTITYDKELGKTAEYLVDYLPLKTPP